MAVVLPMMAVGTASDAYLNISKYATIDQAGAAVAGMETIYKYTEANGGYWLTLSNYGVMKTDDTQNWFTNDMTDVDNTANYITPWTATNVFLGPDAYFGSNTAYTAKYKQPTKYQSFYVTFCTQVKQFAYNRSNSNYYLLKMNIYECTLNADGTVTPNAVPTETVQSTAIGAEVLASGELDPDKIYKVEIANSYSYLYETAFKTPGVFDGEITSPVAYDVTDLTYHQVYDTDNILCEAFTCHWSPCPGVKNYNLRVYPIQPEGLIFRDKFSNITANDVFEPIDDTGYQDLDGYPDHNAWSGHGLQGADGGIVINNGGQLVFSGSEADVSIYRFVKKFTIKFKAKAYDGDTNCRLLFANGSKNLTVDLEPEEKWYTIVVDREYPDYFSRLFIGGLFQNTTYEPGNNRVVITDFKVYYGDYSEPRNVHSPKYIRPDWDRENDITYVYDIPSDSTSFRFGKYINEEGNEQIDMSIGIMDYAYYYYDVQAVYYGGIESDWSNQIPIWLTPWPEFLEDVDDDPIIIEPTEFYLVGTFNNWSQAGDGGRLVFTATDTEGVYEAQGTLEDNAEFKVITPNGDGWTWYGGQDANGVGYFLIDSELLNTPLAMVDGANFRIENGGEYTFSINANDMTLTVVPISNPGIIGDVNCDGSVTTVDITCLYNYLLEGDTTYMATSDVNGDGAINTADITMVYSILLGAE